MKEFSQESENAVLGGMLNYKEILQKAILRLVPQDFYVSYNQVIFAAIKELHLSGLEQVDIQTLILHLKKKYEDETAYNSFAYIAGLLQTTAFNSNIDFYIKDIKDCAKSRRLKRLLNEQLQALSEGKAETEKIISDVIQPQLSLIDNRVEEHLFDSPKLCEAMREDFEAIQSGEKKKNRILSGFTRLDDMSQGFKAGELSVIGARPSMGKTALALSLTHNMLEQNIPVGFLSLEMDKLALTKRLFAISERMQVNKFEMFLETSSLDMTQKSELLQTYMTFERKFSQKPLFVWDFPNDNLSSLITTAHYLVKTQGVKILFVDYIGLIDSGLKQGQPEYEKVSFISKSLKQLARQLSVPVVALCQLTRQVEESKPTLASLRGSGSIEQDADMVMFLHGDREEEGETQKRALILAKNRNGATGVVPLIFEKNITRYSEYQKAAE